MVMDLFVFQFFGDLLNMVLLHLTMHSLYPWDFHERYWGWTVSSCQAEFTGLHALGAFLIPQPALGHIQCLLQSSNLCLYQYFYWGDDFIPI